MLQGRRGPEDFYEIRHQGIYETMSDATGAETTTFFGGQQFARSAILAFNSTHNYEHYGNLVTYMRINDIVPPTSMPQ